MKTLRDYQEENASRAVEILNRLKIVYLAFEVRTGKTVTSLETARLFGAKKVLFVTKKKAISSIREDFNDFGYKFELEIINNESIHKITDTDFDLLISDEHHRNGAFPKINKSTKIIKEKFSHLPMIFLSGTPYPESYSQIYHQFHVSDYSPFKAFYSFYKWAHEFVDIKTKYIGQRQIKDYSNAYYESLKPIIDPYILTYSQKEAGFTTSVNEKVLYVDLNPKTYELIERLKKDLLLIGKEEQVIADTAVKLQSKLHQLYSGTIKFESGNSKIIDLSKAEFIKYTFNNQKIGIFYKFKEEYNALKKVFGDRLTNDLEEFNYTDKNIALQIVSGREGISLRNAESLVYYNIDFSAVSYWQSRDRLTTMERKENNVFWIFSRKGIEGKIYKAVMNKKDYTVNVFKKDFNVKFPKKNN